TSSASSGEAQPTTSAAWSSSSRATPRRSSPARRSPSTAAGRCTRWAAQQAAMPELHGRRWSRADLARHRGRLEQAAGAGLVTVGDGVEGGVRLLELRTGTGFEFDIVVDRAFDIGRCEHAGRALSWQSATGFAGPWFYEPEGL